MRGTRTTIAGIVCHQVNHGFAGDPWLRIQDKEKPRRSGASRHVGSWVIRLPDVVLPQLSVFLAVRTALALWGLSRDEATAADPLSRVQSSMQNRVVIYWAGGASPPGQPYNTRITIRTMITAPPHRTRLS